MLNRRYRNRVLSNHTYDNLLVRVIDVHASPNYLQELRFARNGVVSYDYFKRVLKRAADANDIQVFTGQGTDESSYVTRFFDSVTDKVTSNYIVWAIENPYNEDIAQDSMEVFEYED